MLIFTAKFAVTALPDSVIIFLFIHFKICRGSKSFYFCLLTCALELLSAWKGMRNVRRRLPKRFSSVIRVIHFLSCFPL